MTVTFRCPNPQCDKLLNLDDSLAGRQGKCDNCGATFMIPAAASQPPPASDPNQAAAQSPFAPSYPNPTPATTEYAPYVRIPSITSPSLETIPDISQFELLRPDEKLHKSFRIRVQRPRLNPLIVAAACLFYLLPGIILLLVHFLRKRGHTFLYVTNQRLIIVELSEGFFGKRQALLNYDINCISGFMLHVQSGIKKFLSLFTIKRKRTFYLEITTKSLAQFHIGARQTVGSEFEPGQDAVSLCSELDALVLSIKSNA